MLQQFHLAAPMQKKLNRNDYDDSLPNYILFYFTLILRVGTPLLAKYSFASNGVCCVK